MFRLRIYFNIFKTGQGRGRLVFYGKIAAADVKWHGIECRIDRIKGWYEGYPRCAVGVNHGKIHSE